MKKLIAVFAIVLFAGAAVAGTDVPVTGKALKIVMARQSNVPSVDIMMKSVASQFRNLTLGVIMTGMGADGAEGMKAIFRQGGMTIGQDEASCTVYGMPRACAELGVLNRVVPLSQIPAQIMQATRYRRRA